jgi:hypothetical protein
VPQLLRDGDYELDYHLDTVALLQMFSPYYSIAAISCASGINQHQLSHYANGVISLSLWLNAYKFLVFGEVLLSFNVF